MSGMNSFKKGLLSEYIAMLLYKFKFYKIIHHRLRNFVGEIDLIAIRGKQIVFIEVKSRNSDITERTISKRQQTRITRSAEYFLSRNEKYINYDIRFDLVFCQPYKLPVIIKNAW